MQDSGRGGKSPDGPPAAVCLTAVVQPFAREGPIFITYTHQMEEPGNREVATTEPALTLPLGETERPERALAHR